MKYISNYSDRVTNRECSILTTWVCCLCVYLDSSIYPRSAILVAVVRILTNMKYFYITYRSTVLQNSNENHERIQPTYLSKNQLLF